MADPLTRDVEVTSPTAETPLLELNRASVVLGGVRVLDRITLSIPVGTHTAILGPNGAGKSTFIKLLTLQLYPAVEDAAAPMSREGVPAIEGEGGAPAERDDRPAQEREDGSRAAAPPIRVFGKDRWDVFQLRSQLGIVSADLHDRFVHGNSNGVLTGLDAVVSGFFATHGVFAHQRVTAAMRRQAMEALERVDAGRLARATLDTMSTGEARRVLIARALV
ncbi:MAG: ATP-binding cassette domain-containing protein, partial [Vicinamibacterales bacterium]